jgi:Ca2+ transporting ATPase
MMLSLYFKMKKNLFPGTIAAIATFIVLVIRHSVEEFAIAQKPWEARQIGYYVNFFIMAVTVLVVAVPEGLPLAVTLALAYSVRVCLS